jgi:uncharacterized membrane protein YqhA
MPRPPCPIALHTEINLKIMREPVSVARLVSKSRYVMLAGIIGLLAGVAEACAWSAVDAYHVFIALLHNEEYSKGVVGLLHMLDAFLVAAVLLVVALGTYGLFITPVAQAPEALVAKSLDELKARFVGLLILLMAVTFVEHLLSWTEPMPTLIYGCAVAVVSVALVAYGHWVAR